MSRVAKKLITVPKGVEVTVSNGVISVKGPKGTLTVAKPNHIDLIAEGNELKVDVKNGDTAMGGTIRALVQNCIIGVDKGYERKLELELQWLAMTSTSPSGFRTQLCSRAKKVLAWQRQRRQKL